MNFGTILLTKLALDPVKSASLPPEQMAGTW